MTDLQKLTQIHRSLSYIDNISVADPENPWGGGGGGGRGRARNFGRFVYIYIYIYYIVKFRTATLCYRWHCTKSSDCQVRVRGAPSNLYGVNVTKAVIGVYIYPMYSVVFGV